MTTSRRPSLTSAISDLDETLSVFEIAYFEERFRNDLHAEVLDAFRAVREQGKSKADLARRLSKRPEQISRWLSTPGNLTLDTIAGLLLAMGREPRVTSVLISDRANASHVHPFASRVVSMQQIGTEEFVQDDQPTTDDFGDFLLVAPEECAA